MAKYVNITSATTTTLLQTSDKQATGNISKINISNNHATTVATVSLFLDLVSGSGDFYFFKTVAIPSGVSLVVDDNLAFDIKKYSLKLTNAGSDNLSIIIK